MSDERPEWHRHPNGGGWVQDTAHVDDTAYVGPDAQVSGSARVYGSARVSGSAWVSGSARVYGNAEVYGTARVSGSAWVSGSARVYGSARVCGSAWVKHPRHVLTVGPIGSEDKTITVFRSDTGHGIAVGCWCDPASTVEDLAAEVQRRAPEHAAEYAAVEVLVRLRINEWEQER